MSTAATQRRYTLDEYVALESYANVKHEYFDGQICAVAGGTPEHGTWSANVIAALAAQLRGKPCRVQTSDVRIRVRATGLDTYPDVSVVCGPAERDAEDRNAIVNPTVLVEVTSPSTADYDRGDKLASYQLIPSLREVVFVAHDARKVVVVRRDGEAWTTHEVGEGQVAQLTSLDCELAVDEVYRDDTLGA